MDRPLVVAPSATASDGDDDVHLAAPEKDRRFSDGFSRNRNLSGSSRRSSVASTLKAIKKIANYPEMAAEGDEYVFDKNEVS